MYIRLSEDRGYSNIQDGGIESFYSFSFSTYWDKQHTGFSVLKVINDDMIKPTKGFDEHQHSNMEILTYVISGCLKHKDSFNHEGLLMAGHAQLMTAGVGVSHSEYNASIQNTHLLQIWIEPEKQDLKPRYQSMPVPPHEGLKLVASPDDHAGGHMHIAQDVKVYIGHEAADAEVVYKIPKGRQLYLHMIRGEARLEESAWHQERFHFYAGDGLGLHDKHEKLHIHAVSGIEFILFDLPSISDKR